ncbi:Protein of unknown function (DUF3080) [Idiomarinaceae bacterium HL-53]|nr:Protein of unknown function (DUF3080) [Idiomarinaceae bacterium HL-53]
MLEIESQRISLIGSLQLSHCRLGQLIAEANSSLGKVRNAAAQLQYELEFLSLLPSCLQHDETNSEQRRLLNEVRLFKIATLKDHIHNFITTDEVMRRIVSPARNSLSVPLTTHFRAEGEALTYIVDSLMQAVQTPENISFDPVQWKASMKVLGQSQQLSELWRTIFRAQDWFSQVNPQITEFHRLAKCERKGVRDDAQVLQNIMAKYFLQTLQPEISQWLEAARMLQPPLLALAELTQGQEWKSFTNQLLGTEGAATRLTRETRVHAEQWQVFFAVCELSRPQVTS